MCVCMSMNTCACVSMRVCVRVYVGVEGVSSFTFSVFVFFFVFILAWGMGVRRSGFVVFCFWFGVYVVYIDLCIDGF